MFRGFWGDSLTITTIWGDQPAVNSRYHLPRPYSWVTVFFFTPMSGVMGPFLELGRAHFVMTYYFYAYS